VVRSTLDTVVRNLREIELFTKLVLHETDAVTRLGSVWDLTVAYFLRANNITAAIENIISV